MRRSSIYYDKRTKLSNIFIIFSIIQFYIFRSYSQSINSTIYNLLAGSTTKNVTKLSFASEQMRAAELSQLRRLLQTTPTYRLGHDLVRLVDKSAPDSRRTKLSNIYNSVCLSSSRDAVGERIASSAAVW